MLIDTTGFYAISYDLSSGVNGCFTRLSNSPADFISLYGFNPGYGRHIANGTPAGSTTKPTFFITGSKESEVLILAVTKKECNSLHTSRIQCSIERTYGEAVCVRPRCGR